MISSTMITPPIKKSNKLLFISSTTIISSIIGLVILFIIIYNSYIYPLLHQNKLQLTQDLYNSYINNIKSNTVNSEFIINLNSVLISINIKKSEEEEGKIKLSIGFFQHNKLLCNISEIIDNSAIKFNGEKLNLDINYDNKLIINYNYIYNRYKITINHNKTHFEGRFKIKCSNSPFICNSASFKIIRNLLIDNDYIYDNVFGKNEYSKLTLNDKKEKIYKSGHLFSYLNNKFIDDFLLLTITNETWLLFFIISKVNEKKYKAYMIIKNQLNDNIIYCGCLNKKLKFFHSVNIELNIGNSIDELKFKFYSETLLIDFNTNNINNSELDDNKSVKSIDMTINFNSELYKYSDNVFLLSNKDLSLYKNLLLII